MAPPTAIAVWVISPPINTCKKPPRIRIQRPDNNLLEWNVVKCVLSKGGFKLEIQAFQTRKVTSQKMSFDLKSLIFCWLLIVG